MFYSRLITVHKKNTGSVPCVFMVLEGEGAASQQKSADSLDGSAESMVLGPVPPLSSVRVNTISWFCLRYLKMICIFPYYSFPFLVNLFHFPQVPQAANPALPPPVAASFRPHRCRPSFAPVSRVATSREGGPKGRRFWSSTEARKPSYCSSLGSTAASVRAAPSGTCREHRTSSGTT